jgi:hypothetical protein
MSTTIVTIDKTGVAKDVKISSPEDIYKRCGLKSANDFDHQITWAVDLGDEKVNIKLFAKTVGRANNENKYEFPPPVDTDLYFGTVALAAFTVDDNIVDLDVDTWDTIYEELYGGFEDLGSDDSDETDELEDVPDDMKTKEGYLKDGFVVPDDILLDDVDVDGDESCEHEDSCDASDDGDSDDGDSDSDDESGTDLSEEMYCYDDEI